MTRNGQGGRLSRQQQSAAASTGDVQLQKVSALLKSVKQKWAHHGQCFTAWWNDQNKEARLAILMDWCPYMPLARDKPYLIVDGKKEDVSGVAFIAPEWNQEELVAGTKLVELLRETAQVPDTGEPGSSPGYDAITELCLQHVPHARRLAASGHLKSRLKPDVQRKGINLLLPGRLGQQFVVNQMVPSIQQWLQQGAAIYAKEWEALMMRLDIILSSMAVCLDHYRITVLGRDNYETVAPTQGCAKCGAVERSDGGNRLLSCAGCGMAFYCGKECQKAHWKEHKPKCKDIAAQKAAEAKRGDSGSSTAAAAGESGADPTGSSSSNTAAASGHSKIGDAASSSVEATTAAATSGPDQAA